MVKSTRIKKYHFSIQTVIRLTIFVLFIYLAIDLISRQKLSPDKNFYPTVLGEKTSSSSAQLFLENTIDTIYDKLPPKSQETIKNLDKNPLVATIQEKLEYAKGESAGFPQKQINEIKKSIINTIYKSIMESINTEKQ